MILQTKERPNKSSNFSTVHTDPSSQKTTSEVMCYTRPLSETCANSIAKISTKLPSSLEKRGIKKNLSIISALENIFNQGFPNSLIN